MSELRNGDPDLSQLPPGQVPRAPLPPDLQMLAGLGSAAAAGVQGPSAGPGPAGPGPAASAGPPPPRPVASPGMGGPPSANDTEGTDGFSVADQVKIAKWRDGGTDFSPDLYKAASQSQPRAGQAAPAPTPSGAPTAAAQQGGGVSPAGPGSFTPSQPQVPPGVYPAVSNVNALRNNIIWRQTAQLPTEQQEKDYDQIMKGWMPYSDGVARYISGGPQDPAFQAYSRGTVAAAETGAEHKAAAPYETVAATVDGVEGFVPKPVYLQGPQAVRDWRAGRLTPEGTPTSAGAGAAPTTGAPTTGAPTTGAPPGALPPPRSTIAPAVTPRTAPGTPAGPGAALPPATFGGTPVMTPEQEAESKELGDQRSAILDAEKNAPDLLNRVEVMRNAAQQFRAGPMGGMGASAPERQAFAAWLVDLNNNVLGVKTPALANTVAAGQVIGKEGITLGADLTRALGSREAAQIYQSTQQRVPQIGQTPAAFDALVNSIEMGARRSQDQAAYMRWWLNPNGGGHSSVSGMNEAFNQAYTPESYSSRVVPFDYKASTGNYQPNVIYGTPAGKRLLYDPATNSFSDYAAGR